MLAPVKRAQRGLSIVELLVGMALGLFIVGASIALAMSHLREHRALLLESRLMQDLRNATDLVLLDLRRAGAWGNAGAGVWHHGASVVIENPYAAIAPATAASDAVSFSFSRDSSENHHLDSHEQFGFRLHDGVIEMLLGEGNWQALTDSGTLVVTAFSITPTVQELALPGFCAKDCPSGSTTCPPRQQIRSWTVSITGRSTTGAAVLRSVHSNVRTRNDVIVGACFL